VFNGKRFREEIYPRVRDFIRRMEHSPMVQGSRSKPAARQAAQVVPIRPRAAKV